MVFATLTENNIDTKENEIKPDSSIFRATTRAGFKSKVPKQS
jgi:hypothetical protein